jgi:hypothetical protein
MEDQVLLRFVAVPGPLTGGLTSFCATLIHHV